MTKSIVSILLLIAIHLAMEAQPTREVNDNEIKKVFNKAINAIKLKDYNTALLLLNKVILQKPEFISAYNERGKIFLVQNKLKEAANDFEKTISMDPEFGEAYFGRANIEFLNKNYDKAYQDITTAILKGFTEYTAYYYKGIINLIKNDVSTALLDFTFCIDKKNNFAEAYQDRGSTKFILKDLQGAIADYETAIKLKPGYALAYANLGSVKKEQGDYKAAIDAYEKSLAYDSTQVNVLNKRGVAKYLSGDIEGANSDFASVLKLNPGYLFSINNQAVIYAKNENSGEALNHMNYVIKTQPEKGEFYINRGYLKELSGDLDGACRDWQMADSLNIKEAKIYLKDCKL